MKLVKKIVDFVSKITKNLIESFAAIGGYYTNKKAAFAAISMNLYISRSFFKITGILFIHHEWILNMITFSWNTFNNFFVINNNEKYKIDKIDEDLLLMHIMRSPLEAFDIYIDENFILFCNISINILLVFLFIIFFFSYFNNKSIKKNIPLINLLNFFFNFFFNTFKNLVPNVRYERYFFMLLTTFVFIVFENLGGFYFLELPFTSHAVITLFLSFILFFNYVITMLINFNESCYKKFIQKDINVIMSFFLFFIELISFLIRPFSLGIRLFANILSGHILVHIFFTAFIFAFKFMFWFSLLILVFCLFILIMEIFVAIVQAYIFFILNLIYLNETSKIHI